MATEKNVWALEQRAVGARDREHVAPTETRRTGRVVLLPGRLDVFVWCPLDVLVTVSGLTD